MLLKGLSEVQQEGVDRRAAAEMVLIRLAHVGGDADAGRPRAAVDRRRRNAAAPPPTPNRPGMAARWRCAPLARRRRRGGRCPRWNPPRRRRSRANPRSYRDVVALASGRRPMLHAHLVHSAHLVRFAPGRLELRVRPEAPRDFAAQLAGLLLEATGTRWTIALSNAEGEPTRGRAGPRRRREPPRPRAQPPAGAGGAGGLPRRHHRGGARRRRRRLRPAAGGRRAARGRRTPAKWRSTTPPPPKTKPPTRPHRKTGEPHP